jgi:hypothetical protein
METHYSADEDAGIHFFNWAIIVVAAGVLIAATSDFAPKRSGQASAAAPAATVAMQTVTPPKT